MEFKGDRGIRIAIDVRQDAESFNDQHAMLISDSEEVHSRIALVTPEVERWKTT